LGAAMKAKSSVISVNRLQIKKEKVINGNTSIGILMRCHTGGLIVFLSFRYGVIEMPAEYTDEQILQHLNNKLETTWKNL
jgi:hypothetical protein